MLLELTLRIEKDQRTSYMYNHIKVPIAKNFRGRKPSQILRFCGYMYMRKFSLQNLGRGVLRHGKSEQSVKIVFFTNLRKFSPSKVSRYMVPVLPH